MAPGEEEHWLPALDGDADHGPRIGLSLDSRSYMENAGAHFGADWLGKIKMGLYVRALIAIFGLLVRQGC